jgi:hypothetical protein
MNRRDAIRTGLGTAFAPSFLNYAAADDTKPIDKLPALPNSSPAEPPPIVVAAESAQLLSELVAGKNAEAGWALVESNRVQLSLKNIGEKRLAVFIDPGTILRHEKKTWLVGGPSRYTGQFGGLLQATAFDGDLAPATIGLNAGKSATIMLPVVELNTPEDQKFKAVTSLKAESATDWTKDAPTAAMLVALSSIGASLSVAQGVAWKMAGLEGEKLSRQKVESQTLNEFDRFAVERFSELFKAIPDHNNIKTILAGLHKERLYVQATATGLKRKPGQKLLAEMLAGKSFMGMPAGPVSQSLTDAAPKWACLKLDFNVVNEVRAGLYAIDASLASRTGLGGLFVKFARVRLPLRADTAGDEMMAWLETQMAPSMARLVRTGQGGMTSRFRLENQTTQTLAAIEATTGGDSADQALFELPGLGLAPRGRTSVRIPADSARATRIRFAAI